MALTAPHGPSQLQLKIGSLQKELDQKHQQLQAVQRNYATMVSLLHRRAKEAEVAQAKQQQLTAQSEQLSTQLDAASCRADTAEHQLATGSNFSQQNQQLQSQLDVVTKDRTEEGQQRMALQEQLNRQVAILREMPGHGSRYPCSVSTTQGMEAASLSYLCLSMHYLIWGGTQATHSSQTSACERKAMLFCPYYIGSSRSSMQPPMPSSH